MKNYNNEGLLFTDTFEELFTEIIQERIVKTLRSAYKVKKNCIKTIEPIGVYDDSNVMVVKVIFKDDLGNQEEKKIKFKMTLMNNEKNRLMNFIESSNLIYEDK